VLKDEYSPKRLASKQMKIKPFRVEPDDSTCSVAQKATVARSVDLACNWVAAKACPSLGSLAMGSFSPAYERGFSDATSSKARL
jgi:hypothetical protein